MNAYTRTHVGWSPAPADAFTEHGALPARGYPDCRVRTGDILPSSSPRYTTVESRRGDINAVSTVAPFITFSGVVDAVLFSGFDQQVTITCRDDAGRSVGIVEMGRDILHPLPIRCKSVDVANLEAGVITMRVTGYYYPALRSRPVLTDDLHATIPEDPNTPPGW